MSWSWWPVNGFNVEPAHEGWIQQIFYDGEEGTGTSCAEGLVQATEYDATGCEIWRRVRPFHDVTHVRMVCSCGWTGVTVALADMQGGLVDWTHREPTEAGEARFVTEWQAHLAPMRARDDATCPTCGHHPVDADGRAGR